MSIETPYRYVKYWKFIRLVYYRKRLEVKDYRGCKKIAVDRKNFLVKALLVQFQIEGIAAGQAIVFAPAHIEIIQV